MDYQRVYSNIIEHRRNTPYNGYTERHHIIPRSLGGTDDANNLVDLSAKEHFICHLLLTKIYKKDSNSYYKMAFAFLMMLTRGKNQNRYITSRKYEALKLVKVNYLKTLTGDKNSQHRTMWICNKAEGVNKKIKISDQIPENWEKGRIVQSYRRCKQCNSLLTKELGKKSNKSYCSKECKLAYKKINHYKIENTILYGREAEFLELYLIHKSINKSLKIMGYVGAGGYYIWAKNVLAKHALLV